MEGGGSFKLAWVVLLDDARGCLRTVAAEGATGYLDGIEFGADEEPTGLGPTGMTIRDSCR